MIKTIETKTTIIKRRNNNKKKLGRIRMTQQ